MRPLPLLPACLLLASCAARLERFEFTERHMATPVRIVLYAPDAEKAKAASTAAFKEIAEVDARMSDYKPESELNRLSDSAGQGERPVSAELYEVLKAAQRYSELSDGAFDITVGPVVWLWREARKAKKLPDPLKLKAALALVGYRKLALGDRTARLETPGMRLDLGAIAKGYSCDRALAAMQGLGIKQALVAAGGDMALGDPPPGAKGWRVQIIDGPTMIVSRCGVGTSGDLERFVEVDGHRYSHIVDPKTGMGIEGMTTVVILAQDGMAADALATTVSVLGPKRGLALVASLPGVRARIHWKNGDQVHIDQSPGFDSALSSE